MKRKFLFFSLALWLFYGTAWAQTNYGNLEEGNAGNNVYNNNVIYIDTGTNIPQINLYLKGNVQIPVSPLIFYDTDPRNYTVLTRKLSEARHVQHKMYGTHISNKSGPEYKVNNYNLKLFRIPNAGNTCVGVSLISKHKLNSAGSINGKKRKSKFLKKS